MIGGGCTFLKLAQKVDDIKTTLQNDEQRVSQLDRPPQPTTCSTGFASSWTFLYFYLDMTGPTSAPVVCSSSC